VIHLLVEGSPSDQKNTLEAYFVPHASFTHPLCRVPSFSHYSFPLIGEIDSRWVIWMIYRWYKILSPRIILDVECGGKYPSFNSKRSVHNYILEFNQKSSILFVEIRQIFSLFFVPFYKSNVHLTTKLHLVYCKNDQKYYIRSQEDLYQLNEVVKFFWPGGATIIWLWQMFTTALCLFGALALAPVTRMEQKQVNGVNSSEENL
jgi:hypothetical protein